MAVISMFYGIVISMFFMDNRQYKLPHIHVKYQDKTAIFSIPEGEIIEGNVPSTKKKLVQAWIEIHQEDLIANWELASSGQSIFPIDPLK